MTWLSVFAPDAPRAPERPTVHSTQFLQKPEELFVPYLKAVAYHSETM